MSAFSTTEAGALLGYSREHVRRLIHAGALRATERVHGFRIEAEEIARFQEARAAAPHQDAAQLARIEEKLDGLTVKVDRLIALLTAS